MRARIVGSRCLGLRDQRLNVPSDEIPNGRSVEQWVDRRQELRDLVVVGVESAEARLAFSLVVRTKRLDERQVGIDMFLPDVLELLSRIGAIDVGDRPCQVSAVCVEGFARGLECRRLAHSSTHGFGSQYQVLAQEAVEGQPEVRARTERIPAPS